MARPLLKPHASLFAALLRALDPAVALAAGAAAFGLYRPSVVTPEPYLLFAVAGAMTIVALFPAFGLYGPQRGASLADELRNLLLAWLVIAALAAGALFATKSGEAFSRVWVAAWLAGGFLATAVMRIALRVALRALRRHGHNLRHIAIVGAGTLGTRVADATGRRRLGRLQCRGVLRRRHGQARHTGGRAALSPADPSALPRTSPPARSTRSGSRCPCAPKRGCAKS